METTLRNLMVKGQALKQRVRTLADKTEDVWKTINGRHVLVGKGETPLEALNKRAGEGGQNSAPIKERSIKDLKKFPGKVGELKTPVPVIKNGLSKNINESYDYYEGLLKDIRRKGKLESLPIQSLVTIQGQVNVGRLGKLIKGDRSISPPPIFGVRMATGQVVIVDGDHRLAAAWLKGHEKINVKVLPSN